MLSLKHDTVKTWLARAPLFVGPLVFCLGLILARLIYGVPDRALYREYRGLFASGAPTLRRAWIGPVVAHTSQTLDRVYELDSDAAKDLAERTGQWKGWAWSKDGHFTMNRAVCGHFLFGSNTWVRVYFAVKVGTTSLGYFMLRDNPYGIPIDAWRYGMRDECGIPGYSRDFMDLVAKAGARWVKADPHIRSDEHARMMPRMGGRIDAVGKQEDASLSQEPNLFQSAYGAPTNSWDTSVRCSSPHIR